MDERGNETTTRNPTAQEIGEHMPLVHGIVAQFMRKLPRSVQREDLVAAGTVGLFHALRSSSHTCPEMFASYARIRIRGSIVDELRRHDWSPRRRKVAAPATETTNATPAKPTASTPAPRLSLVPGCGTDLTKDAAQAREVAVPRERVQVVGFDDLPPQNAELAEDSASPLDDVLQRRAYEALHAAVESLPAREREIVRMRYFQGMASKAIAQALGLSEARISQLHARATNRLREILAENGETSEVKLAA